MTNWLVIMKFDKLMRANLQAKMYCQHIRPVKEIAFFS